MDSKSVLLLAAAVIAFASPSYSYDESCSRRAQQLKNAAEEYESAMFDYRGAKLSYENACDPWGGSQFAMRACAGHTDTSPVPSRAHRAT